MSLKSLFISFFCASARFSHLERRILDCIRSHLDKDITVFWDKQIASINKIQRLPQGVEVDFYRMKNGYPTFDSEIAFPNRTQELQLARVNVHIIDILQKLEARIWCIEGFLFSIEYDCDTRYFEEAASLDDQTILNISCELTADLSGVSQNIF